MKSTMRSFMKIKIRHIGVIVCLTCLIATGAVAAEDAAAKDYGGYPQPDEGYVTDTANLLTDAQEAQLEKWLYDCEQENGFEMAVVTIGSIADYPGTNNGSIEAFATGLFDRYGVGNMPKNDGVLLLVAVKDREARIELGDGYESNRDQDANRIMQNTIVPQFRNGRYDSGILNGTKAILLTFAGKDVTAGQQTHQPQNAIPVQQAQPAPMPASTRTTSPSHTPRPVPLSRPNRRPGGFGATGLVIGLLFMGMVMMLILGVVKVFTGGGGSGSYGAGNSMVGLDDDGIVSDDGYNRGFLSGLFMGGSRYGHRGLHNGGIHFGGSSRRHGIGFGGLSSHNHGIGFGSRHSAGGFGGGFGGGFSGGSHRSSFGGGFSRGGGATGKW